MRSLLILCYSDLESDSRILRQALTFHEAGYLVTVVHIGPSQGEQWPFRTISTQAKKGTQATSSTSTRVPLKTTLKQSKYLAPVAWLWRKFGFFVYWVSLLSRTHFKWTTSDRLLFERAIPNEPFDFIIANDWHTLPPAFSKRCLGTPKVIYDSHENAATEVDYTFQGRFFRKPIVLKCEGEFLPLLSGLVSVSQSNIDSIQARYSVSKPNCVIRNIPNQTSLEPSPLEETNIKIVHLGYVYANRKIDNLIRAMLLLPKQYSLHIVGFKTPNSEYEKSLLALTAELALQSRVTFYPLVSSDLVVRTANQFDVGMILIDPQYDQNNVALPNKFFEYINAGLAVGTTKTKEISNFICENQNGFVIESDKPESIATAILSQSPADLSLQKKNSFESALTNRWETEKTRFVDFVHSLEITSTQTPSL